LYKELILQNFGTLSTVRTQDCVFILDGISTLIYNAAGKAQNFIEFGPRGLILKYFYLLRNGNNKSRYQNINYTRDQKTRHLSTETMRLPDILSSGFQMAIAI
jgi:hypothetical protein